VINISSRLTTPSANNFFKASPIYIKFTKEVIRESRVPKQCFREKTLRILTLNKNKINSTTNVLKVDMHIIVALIMFLALNYKMFDARTEF